MDQTVDKLPKSALALYVKLYCKRKVSSNSKYSNNLIEATKSWLSLRENEKQQFTDKYKEYQIKYRKLLANYLKNAEPYMKKRDCKRKTSNDAEAIKDRRVTPEPQSLGYKSQENASLDSPSVTNTDMDMQIVPHLQHQQSINDRQDSPESTLTPRTATHMEGDHVQDEQNTDEPQEHLGCELPEPAPPSLKTSKELFEMTKTMDDEGTISTWESLSRAEKSRYQFAVRSIKKEYINKYKAYLESLPSNKLFDHYNKIL